MLILTLTAVAVGRATHTAKSAEEWRVLGISMGLFALLWIAVVLWLQIWRRPRLLTTTTDPKELRFALRVVVAFQLLAQRTRAMKWLRWSVLGVSCSRRSSHANACQARSSDAKAIA
jgi:hypothetical protein